MSLPILSCLSNGMFTYIFGIYTLIYVAFLAWLERGAFAICKAEKAKPEPDSQQAISIIIAAKNELPHLPHLLYSLAALRYPDSCYEVIIVNDHSSDGSAEYLFTQSIVPNLRVIDFTWTQVGLVGKKAAIQQGINAARYNILAFTDADCLVPPNWLKEINRSMTEETDYLLAYSVMQRTPTGSAFRLKNFERGVYYALAAAGLHYRIPFTSSACNMVYRKSVFEASGGFDGIGHLLSGDDDLLLMKMIPNIRKAAFNPSLRMQVCSIDGTDAAKHHQTNIRRASKFLLHPWWLQLTSALIFVYFCLFYWGLFSAIFGQPNGILVLSLIMKTSTEFSFCIHHFRRIGQAKLGALYPVQILLFPAQFIFYALRGTLGRYSWK